MLQIGVGIRILNSAAGRGIPGRRGARMTTVRKWRATAPALAQLCWCAALIRAQAAPGAQESFRLKLPVNEVVLTFHAADPQGAPVTDLKPNEVTILDNGSPPRRIIAFDPLLDRPIRAGILLDTSDSMQRELSRNKAIAERYATRMIRQSSDQAFVMDFGFTWEMAQPWTPEPARLSQAIRNVRLKGASPLGGTALFDAIFRACYYGFDKIDPTVTGNFLLLLSDGEDTRGHTSMEEALKACQLSNIVIYVFRPPLGAGYSTGPKTLQELAEKTGGRVFAADDSKDAIEADFKTIDSEMRNQYRLVYAPAELKPDGSFHRIELQLPGRVSRFNVRPGYYAPGQ